MKNKAFNLFMEISASYAPIQLTDVKKPPYIFQVISQEISGWEWDPPRVPLTGTMILRAVSPSTCLRTRSYSCSFNVTLRYNRNRAGIYSPKRCSAAHSILMLRFFFLFLHVIDLTRFIVFSFFGTGNSGMRHLNESFKIEVVQEKHLCLFDYVLYLFKVSFLQQTSQ